MTKKKLIVSLCAFVLVVAVGVVGVLAATSVSSTISTQVGFTATDVVGTATLSVSNNGNVVQVDGQNTYVWTFAHSTEQKTFQSAKVDVAAQNFQEVAGAYIEYKFVIRNDGDKAFTVTPTITDGADQPLTAIENVTITSELKVGATELDATTAVAGSTQVAKTNIAVYTYRMTINDISKSVAETTLNIQIVLQ